MAQARVAVITGGTRGIGLALAHTFAAAGYSVTLTGRNESHLKTALSGLARHGKQVQATLCDVTDPAAVNALFLKLKGNYGAIDVLVNNAGVAHPLTDVEQLPLETWKEVIDTNLTGTFLVTQAALPLMKHGGTIVNNLSVAATQPFAGMSAYNASKYGAL
ncbi:MAG TPA: SDR family oxidoreductase, partial [Verrucomicrobiae bacterium]|nr:SDR family oxidoreductase [Verrucomicrobiae bacterium]